ncbi:MAG: dolichol kinase [Aeropyrum sp.]|nr:dolichol kinase [Aeropyrum sp.]
MPACGLAPARPALEALYALLLALYVVFVVVPVSRTLYRLLESRGVASDRAVYYTRKFIHIAAGGVSAILTPILFTTPLIPLAASTAMAAYLYFRHTRGKMGWFQTGRDMYDVSFNIAWGLSIAVLWCVTGDPWLSILPALFISLGDGVTGIVRNALVYRRSKHWSGNVAMMLVSIPLGYLIAGWPGALAGLVSSIVERLEVGPLDDNIIIALTSTAIILSSTLL